MNRVAIFVDAGYLFAQSSVALCGEKRPRSSLTLAEQAIFAELRCIADLQSGNASLLRIYWYDGAKGFRGPTTDQIRIAHADNVKIRLGFVNSAGEQKGVDSLIVTDLIELARNRAMTDAVLLAGDEDLRIAVQIAQSFGVRVHLIGITPSRASQSKLLLQEADTTTEWGVETVRKFCEIDSPTAPDNPTQMQPARHLDMPMRAGPADLESIARNLAISIGQKGLKSIMAHRAHNNRLPAEWDAKLLVLSRRALGRNLEPEERRNIRRRFLTLVETAADTS